jgi:hypothetical protein
MSSECERLFSRINLLLSDERRSLSPKAVESEVLLHNLQVQNLIRINRNASFSAVMEREIEQVGYAI